MSHRFTRLMVVVSAFVLMGQGCTLTGRSGVSGPAGMFVSQDKGESWQQLSQLPTTQGVRTLSDVNVYRLVGDPQDPNAMYWLSRSKGLFFTYDEGKTWQRPSPPLNQGFIYAVAVHPEIKCTLYATNGTQVFRTQDCSRSWEEVYRESRASERINGIAIDPFFSDTVFLALQGGDVLKSTDRGLNWDTTHRLGDQLVDIAVDPNQDGVMYIVSRRNGLYRSTDGGATWNSIANTMAEFSGALEYRRFFVHPQKSGVLYWVSTYGILVSNTSGDRWRALDLITPPGSAQIYGFAVNPQNDQELYYTATINGRSTFYKSGDGGVTWKTNRLPSTQLPTVLHVHPAKEPVVYLGYTVPPS